MTDFLVNGIYPPDYFRQTGVDQIKYPHQYWWSSRERYASIDSTNGGGYLSTAQGGIRTSEFLEIDLGRVRPINYINFQVVKAPLDVTICYDSISDDDGTHTWVEVTQIEDEPFESTINYSASTKSAFHDAEYYFTDSLGKTVFTRFIRIQFTRKDVEWPHKGATPFRWPVIVKALRHARSISSYQDAMGLVFDTGPGDDNPANRIIWSGVTGDNLVDTGYQIASDFVCQQIAMPEDFQRLDVQPKLMGFAIAVYIEQPPGFDTGDAADEAMVAWELWDATNNVKLRNGTATGAVNEGRAWMNCLFDPEDPLVIDESSLAARRVYEVRVRSMTVHDALGQPNLEKYIRQPNLVPGFWMPGGGTFVNAGNGASPAAGSSSVIVPGYDLTSVLHNGDLIRRTDLLGGYVATVQTVSYGGGSTTITLTLPWQGPSGVGVPFEKVLSMRDGVSGTADFNHSLAVRLFADVADQGRDVLGNIFRYATRRQEASNVFNASSPGWQSEPQPSQDAVEAMYFDLRWQDSTGTNQPAVVDAIRIAPRTPGCLMHVYYCTDHGPGDRPKNRQVWDQMVWQPIHATYQLQANMTIELPQTIKANFIKLEFTRLQPRLFPTGTKPGHHSVEYRRYPTWIETQFENSQIRRTVQDWFVDASKRGLVKLDYLKFTKDPILEFQYKEREFLAALARNKDFDKAEVNSGLIDTSSNSFIDPTTGAAIVVHTNSMYRSPLVLNVDKTSILGQAVAAQQSTTLRTAVREGGFEVSRDTAPFVSTSSDRISESFSHLAQTPMWFNQTCRHVYKVDRARFNKKAYYVGIQSVEFLRKDYTQARDDTLIVENLLDDQMLSDNSWESDGTNRLIVAIEGSS